MYNRAEVVIINIRELRTKLGDTQSEFSARYNIPFRTVQNWEAGIRTPPGYVLDLLEERIREDLVNRRTPALPEYDPKKKDLPARGSYISCLDWLRVVREAVGEEVVFAMDEALICHGLFQGRSDEYLVWVYGSDRLNRFNGVIVIGNSISERCILRRDGLVYTDLNRTLADCFANEKILDMQGITEAISKYYYSGNESFRGLSIAPEYQDRFDMLARDAIDYYDE